jgi:hypothetical protein
LAAALTVAPATPAAAQRFLSLEGLDVRVGVYWPERAQAGFGFASDVDLGQWGDGSLRPFIGAFSFGADVDEATGDDGSYRGVGGRAGLRLASFSGRIQPHLLAAISATSIDASLDDPRSSELLDGFYLGFDVGIGAAMPVTRGDRLFGVAEFRRTISSNVSRYALDVGLRYLVRSR